MNSETAQLSEEALVLRITELLERVRYGDACTLYDEWSRTNTARSALTLSHVANAMLLHGRIGDADVIASKMMLTTDYGDNPLLWGDFLADMAMVHMKHGRLQLARYVLQNSTKELKGQNADESRLLRNEFFVTRIMAREGSPAAVHALWNIRNRYEQLLYTDDNANAIYFRNLSWWLVIFAARFPEATVSIEGIPHSPFGYICTDALYGISLESGWAGMEMRPRHRQVLEFLKEHPRLRKMLARAIISGRIHTS